MMSRKEKGLYDETSLLYCASSLVCTCYALPAYGNFTLGEMYGFVYTIDGIKLVDDGGQIVTVLEKDFDTCFHNIAEVVTTVSHPMMYDTTIYHVYLILNQDTCNLQEIKAYAKLCHINYIQAKKALTNQRNLIASGNACEVKEILYHLKQFQVHYEIEPQYPYEKESEA